jgi:transcriptional regulator with XRE-family HTH domain
MIALSNDAAYGRFIQAARVLAGLDQTELGALAGVSGSTISNIETGRNSTVTTRKAVRTALHKKGVNLSFGNDQINLGIAFVDRNQEADDD